MEYILILYIYAGMLAKGDSVALTNVTFKSMEACQAAGKQAEFLVKGSTKEVKFICVKS